ncbi:T9SS type A sorting domain-containing protein [Marinigracilibium pacificum]|uniref:T9SS type A sorting domain-containing protein n=1 Tax=Marinigracilibium pacificum TaxID=2729599 RepID=A0A848J1F7_9BACT|nr:T9SS type A sorting domain-containing protein [Marinigracilibium pacificum]NMM48139.1 T9SS type A sorting domain-containing protein [Marinigracilibium pacificum]
MLCRFLILLPLILFTFSTKGQTTVNDQKGNWEDPSHWVTGIPGSITGNLLSLTNNTTIINGTTIAERDFYLSNSSLVINPEDTLVINGDLYVDYFSTVQNNGLLVVLGNASTSWFSAIYNSGEVVVKGDVGGFDWGTDSGDSYTYGNTGTFTQVGEEGDENDLLANNPGLHAYVDEMITILPVELISFEIDINEDEVYLTWATVNEKNNDYFEILRSKDGTNWYSVGQVAGNGNTTNIVNYSYTDKPDNSGTFYYRLKQVDFNGDYEEFSIQRISFHREQVTIFPNPFKDWLMINTKYNQIQIFNETGEFIYEIPNQGTMAEIYTGDWKKGIYLVKIVSDQEITNQKIVK